jgi:rhodanese-related sulfurtransferase
MKKLFAIIAVSTFFLSGCGGNSSASTNLGAQEFQAKTQESGVITLDVRTPGEFVSGHLVNALNIDVESGQFDAEIAKLDKSATYAVYCRSGRRSQVAIDRMKDAGFTNLFNLNAGVQEWAAAGLQLVTN